MRNAYNGDRDEDRFGPCRDWKKFPFIKWRLILRPMKIREILDKVKLLKCPPIYIYIKKRP